MAENKIVKPKIDVVFKKLFGDPANIHILKRFISSVLGIEMEKITEIVVESEELLPEFADEKFGRVDIKVTIDHKEKINIELQAVWYGDYKDRSLFYWSKIFAYGLKSGEPYGELLRTVCINIVGFNVFKCKEYSSHFTLREVTRNEEYSDKMALHFFELKKLPEKTEENKNDPLLQWLWLINAETEEELDMLEKSDIPEIRDAVNVVRYFSADEQMKINAFEREMAIRDRMAEIAAAKRDGRAEMEEEIKKAKDEAEEEIKKAKDEAEEKIKKARDEAARVEVKSVKALMTKLKLTAEEAMDILETPADKREIYRKMIEEE